jgi:hypothetical protein
MKNNFNPRLTALFIFCILFISVVTIANAQEGPKNGQKRVIRNNSEQLAEPQLVAPIANAKLGNYPRKTTYEWKHVANAGSYEIEIEYNDGKWQPFQKATVKVVSYICDFVGANPGRWRVRAIGKDGKEGPFCQWREFKYTT